MFRKLYNNHMCLGPLPPPLIDENGTEWLTFTNSGPSTPVHFDFEFLCNNSCSVFVKGEGWTKRSILGSNGVTQSDCSLSALWFDYSVNAFQVLSYNALWVLWVFRVLLLKLILAKKMKIESSWQTWSRWTKISISWAPVITFIGEPTFEPFVSLEVKIEEQFLILEYFDENDDIQSETFWCPINDSTIIRLSYIQEKVTTF